MIIGNNNNRRINSTVMDTVIKAKAVWNSSNESYDYFINVYEDDIKNLFTKIKKTIFDICLVK